MSGPTGGTITTNGTKTVHTFTSSGTFTPNKSGNVEVLVVGGGGGGGGLYYAGGGGGGHVEYSSSHAVTAQEYTVTVGAGGKGGSQGQTGSQGGTSSFDSLSASGGLGGYYGNASGNPNTSDGLGGTVNSGGHGGTSDSPYPGGGGGGGDSSAGSDHSGSAGGAGGAGTSNSISGSSVTYGGGGGGAGYYQNKGGAGGTGGGGKGGGIDGAAVAGTANTGGGGGGGYWDTGSAVGGSGVVIISYLTADFEEGTKAEISDSATASDSFDSLIDGLSESSTVDDTITAGFQLSSEIADNATISDLFEAFLDAPDIEDNITASASFTAGYLLDSEMADSATVSDDFNASGAYPETIEESLDFGDTDEYLLTMCPSISENLGLSGSSFPGWFAAVSDSIFIYDAIRNGWIVTAESTLDFADSIETILGIIVDEWLTLIDSEANNWNGREIIDEPITLYDIVQGVKVYSDSLTDTVNFADTSLYSLSIAILEYLGFTDLAAAMRTTAAAVSESLDIADAPAWAFPLSVESALNLVDASTVITTFLNTVQSNLGLADVSSLIARVSSTVTESIVFIDSVAAKGTLYNVLYDTLALNVTVELDGEIWECYVLNTPKFLPSIYSGFDFNSYCIFESRAFGANSTGIYELTGPTDAGAEIHTGAILSKTDFGSANQKKFRKGYLDISGTAPKMILETESGERQAYSIDAQGKVTASTALKSKKWTLSVAEFESLSSMKFIPIILTK